MFHIRITIGLIICLIFSFLSFVNATDIVPRVTNGTVDLSSWNFQSCGSISINGKWEYYKNQLLSPQDFENKNSVCQFFYADPGNWNDTGNNRTAKTNEGYATYRLIISGLDTSKTKALRLSSQMTAYRLWIDGIEYSRKGMFGEDRSIARSYSGIDIVSFKPHHNAIEVVLQVCNYWNYYANGGIGPVFLGDASQVKMEQERSWIFQIVIVVTLLVMGLYHILNYFAKQKDFSPLYFGIFCLLLSINVIVSSSGEWLLTELNQALSGAILYKIDIITVMLSIPCMVMFLHSFFPQEKRPLVLKSVLVITGFFIVSISFAKYKTLTITYEAYYPVILLMVVYCAWISMLAAAKKRPDAIWVLAGILLLSFTGVNDVLWGYGIVHTPILVPAATFIFVLIYSTLISRRYSRALTAAEQLSLELIENQRLRDEMQQRIKKEQDLRQMQRRLTELLHTLDEALCVVYDTGDITFCSRAFEEFTGYTLPQLSGKSLVKALDITCHGLSQGADEITIDTNEKWPLRISLTDSAGRQHVRDIVKFPLEFEDEQLAVFIIRVPGLDASKEISAIAFIEELNKNRLRIQALNDMLINATPDAVLNNPSLGQELQTIDMNLAQLGSLLSTEEDVEKKKQLGSEILNIAIQYWTKCTGKTKTDLARESTLWKVHVNPDGWERAKTLDRYLELKTFPKNPRWNQITKTADFVLVRCSDDSSLRQQLEISLQRLHILS